MTAWTGFLSAMVLTLLRVSGMVAFAPFFSSPALPVRTKAVFVGAVAYLLAPMVASLPAAHVEITFASLLGEIAVGLVYGLVLSLLNEMLLFAGQIAGVQFSFSMVNLLDPTSNIQTPLMGDLFQLMGILVLIAAGLDRILLASMVRSFHAVPLGGYTLTPVTAHAIVQAAGGIFLAAVELAAPVLAATMLIEVAVALLSKHSSLPRRLNSCRPTWPQSPRNYLSPKHRRRHSSLSLRNLDREASSINFRADLELIHCHHTATDSVSKIRCLQQAPYLSLQSAG